MKLRSGRIVLNPVTRKQILYDDIRQKLDTIATLSTLYSVRSFPKNTNYYSKQSSNIIELYTLLNKRWEEVHEKIINIAGRKALQFIRELSSVHNKGTINGKKVEGECTHNGRLLLKSCIRLLIDFVKLVSEKRLLHKNINL